MPNSVLCTETSVASFMVPVVDKVAVGLLLSTKMDVLDSTLVLPL